MLFTSLCLHNIYAYNLAVVGASGRLGRELVYQSIKDYNYQVLGLTSKPYCIYELLGFLICTFLYFFLFILFKRYECKYN